MTAGSLEQSLAARNAGSQHVILARSALREKVPVGRLSQVRPSGLRECGGWLRSPLLVKAAATPKRQTRTPLCEV